MMEIKREDWEQIISELELERKTMLIHLEVNKAALHMAETKLKFLPKEEKVKDEKGKPKPSSYVG